MAKATKNVSSQLLYLFNDFDCNNMIIKLTLNKSNALIVVLSIDFRSQKRQKLHISILLCALKTQTM